MREVRSVRNRLAVAMRVAHAHDDVPDAGTGEVDPPEALDAARQLDAAHRRITA